jgi:hypothetical protein
MRKWLQLPGSHVAGEKEHPLALALGGREILETIENNHAFDILARVLWQVREFRGQPAEVAHDCAHDFLSLGICPIRESQLQIEERHLAPSGLEPEQKCR